MFIIEIHFLLMFQAFNSSFPNLSRVDDILHLLKKNSKFNVGHARYRELARDTQRLVHKLEKYIEIVENMKGL